MQFPLRMSFHSVARSRETFTEVYSFDGKTNTSQENPGIYAPFVRQ